MKWRCALIQRWLPEYPDGELSPFRRRRLEAHLRDCPACRKELAEIREVEQAYRKHPLPEPGPDFWEKFQRELHLRLASLNQQTQVPEPRRFKLPYLVGASALALFIIFISHYLVNLQRPGEPSRLAESFKLEQPLGGAKESSVELAREPRPLPEMGRFREADADQVLMIYQKSQAGHAVAPEEVIYAGLNDGLWQEEIPSWDVDAVVADLSPQERELLAENLSSRR